MIKKSYYLALFLTVAVPLWFLPDLPSSMAWYFNEYGDASRWQPLPFVAGVYVLLLILVHGTLISVPSMFSPNDGLFYFVPNGGGWSALGQKEQTYKYVTSSWACLALVTLIYVLALVHMVIQANLMVEPELPSPGFWLPTYIYVGFLIVWLFLWFENFSRDRLRKQSSARGLTGTTAAKEVDYMAEFEEQKKAEADVLDLAEGRKAASSEKSKKKQDRLDDSPDGPDKKDPS